MAELLTTINPNAENREAGDIVVIKEDGWQWSDLERKLFAIVRVPMSVADAELRYLRSGVPDEVQQRYDTAKENFRALSSAKNRDENLIALAKQEFENSFYNPLDYYDKATKIDTSVLPAEVVQVAIDTKAALDDFQKVAKDAARAKVEEELIKFDGEILPENKELHTSQLIEVYERNLGEFTKDALLKASRDGRMEIIKPLLDSIETPPVIEMSAQDLELITSDKVV